MNTTSRKGESFGTNMADQFSGMPMEEGVVIRSGAGTYDVELISLTGGFPVTCICLNNVLAASVGASDCSLPPVGAIMLFTRFSRNAGSGVAFGISPGLGHTVKDKLFNSYTCVPSGGTSAYCNDGYMKLAKEFKEQVSFSDTERPCDTYPGDHLITNEAGVMFGLLRMLTFMRATERAKLEMFVLDDLVRLVSGHYQHFSSLGDLQVYNDEGRASMEFRATQHQQEYYGAEEYKPFAKLRNQDREKENITTGSEQTYDTKNAVSLKERIQAFIGDLGNLVHLIICNPELTEDKLRLRGGAYNHSGLFQQAVTTSGAMAVRTADTLILQRGDTIPVPVKMKEPWDPNGDKAEDMDKKREADKPYQLKDADPWAGSLMLRDQVAWLHKQIYAEFDLHEKDWHVPEENELAAPNNTYDRIDGDKTDFDKALGRKSCFGQLRDGSIVLRDAWGSEIFMRGGNIIISCPGQIEYRSGKSQVMMAGHDVCVRAKESVDISATSRDVRIMAQGNLHMAAVAKGILIQSYSDIEEKGFTKKFRFSDGGKIKFGEDVESAGIILKCERDRIFIYGWTTQIAAACYLFIETLMARAFGGAKENKPPGFPSDAGQIVISATNKLVHRCKDFLVSVAGRTGIKSGLTRTPSGDSYGNMHIFGSQVMVSTGAESGFAIRANGNNVERNDNAAMQVGKIVYDSDKDGSAKQQYKRLMDTIKVEDGIYGDNDFLKRKEYYAYDPDNPGDSQRFWINFTFRTQAQYGTNRPSEMKYAPSDVKQAGSTELAATTMGWTKTFKIYQSPWQFLYKDDPDIVPWVESGFFGSAPWPGWGWGKDDQVFAYLEKEQNVDFWGRATKRSAMKNEAEELKMGNMLQYKVLAHNASKPNELTQ